MLSANTTYLLKSYCIIDITLPYRYCVCVYVVCLSVCLPVNKQNHHSNSKSTHNSSTYMKTVCLSICLSSFIKTQTLCYISNTKCKQATEFSFSLMQATLIISIVYVLIYFSREVMTQIVEDDFSVTSL